MRNWSITKKALMFGLIIGIVLAVLYSLAFVGCSKKFNLDKYYKQSVELGDTLKGVMASDCATASLPKFVPAMILFPLAWFFSFGFLISSLTLQVINIVFNATFIALIIGLVSDVLFGSANPESASQTGGNPNLNNDLPQNLE